LKAILLLLLAAVAGGAAWVVWNASRAVDASAAAVRKDAEVPFSRKALDPVALPGWESFPSVSSFRQAAAFDSRLWLLTSNTVWRVENERAEPLYRAGRELPPAHLTVMATALVSGAAGPQLFLGTRGEGLVAFDGQALVQLRPEADAAARKVTALLALESGQLLIGTDGAGVLVWDGQRFSRFHETLTGLSVSAVAGTLDDLWVGTRDRGLAHWKAGQVEWFAEGVALPDRNVLALVVEPGRRAFAGTALGIAEFREGRPYRTFAEGALTTSLLLDDGKLLAGTLEEGVAEIDLQSRAPRPRQAIAGTVGEVRQLLRVDGKRYVLTPRGLTGWDGRAAVEGAEGLLADGNVAALAAESSGRLWVGYFDHGLDILEPGGGKAIHREDDVVFCVNRIVPRADGGALVGTANGLVFADSLGRTRQVLTKKDGLMASHVTDILADADRIVVATPAGLTFLDPTGPQGVFAFHGLVNNHVYALARNGSKILAGTLGGASLLDNTTVKASFTNANSPLRQNWISAAVYAGGEFFAATYGAGVYRYDGSVWQATGSNDFTVNPGALAATPEGHRIYAGTLDRGLAVWTRERGRWSFSTAGLPSANVTAIITSGGFVTIGTDNGLVRIAEGGLP
jgi:ligand-binding sensor domain-containing protein